MGDPNMAPMTELARLNLRRHRQSLIDDLDVEFISDHLIEEFVLEVDDVELIMSKATRRRKAVTFLNMITTKGQHAYNCTYSALKKMQPHLALFLEDAVTGQGHLVKGASLDGFTKAQADILLRKGGVPIPPSVFTPRPNHVVKIKEALMNLKDGPGWCVVHGMGGIGKSVIAAASVRDTEILSDVFPGGLFWLSVGNVDKAKLLSKVQNLCARLDEDIDRSPPHNLEEGKDRLRALFIDKHPRSLLILDDVWSTRVIHTFDVQARVMVTTRDRGVTDRVTGPVHRVQLEEGFSEEQALATLAAWTLQEVNTLPPEAKAIYEASKGSPLVISIIGALLADHPTRWKYYLDKLTRKRYASLKKVTAYEYGSVGEAMGMSLEQLPEELRDIYKSFAIFAEDVPIPASVLGVMHGEEQESIEDMMEEIINKSLAFQEWNTTYKCQMYTIHDLQLDFLTEQYKTDIQAQHRMQIELEQQKARETEERLQKTRAAEEQRVADLESKLSDLSDTVGTYDRGRQQDQHAIQRLKERISQLDLENTALARAANKSTVMAINEEEDLDSEASVAEIKERIMKLKGLFKLACHKAEKPVDIDDVLNIDDYSSREGDPNHSACQQELKRLKEEFESYKTRASNVLKNRTTRDTTHNKELEQLQGQLADMRERVSILRQQLDDEEAAHKQSIEDFQQRVAKMKDKHKVTLAQAENEYKLKAADLDQQVQKQRERTIALLADKDQVVNDLKIQLNPSQSYQHAPPHTSSDHYSPADDVQSVASEDYVSSETEETVSQLVHAPHSPGQTGSSFLHFAEEQARKEVELAGVKRQKQQVETALRQLQDKHANSVQNYQEEMENLRDEVDRWQRNRSREGTNLEYLKNVVLSYYQTDSYSTKKQMFNAIAAILQFTKKEKDAVTKKLGAAWWGTG